MSKKIKTGRKCALLEMLYFLRRVTSRPATPIANKAKDSGSGTTLTSANAGVAAIDSNNKEANLRMVFTLKN